MGAALAALTIDLDWMGVTVSLPKMATDLHAQPTDLQWVNTAFTLGFGGLLAGSGWVIDAYGRRRTSMYGMGIFLLGSFLCMAAPAVPWLIAGRAVQGVAAAFVVPGAIAMIAAVSGGRKQGAELATVVAAASAGTALGPLVGGLLTDLLGWRWVFSLSWPVALAAVALIYRQVPPSRNPAVAGKPFPLLTMTCLTLGVVALTITIDRSNTSGWTSFATLTGLSSGVGLLTAYAYLERNTTTPILPHRIYEDRNLRMLTIVGTTSVIGFVLLSTFSVMYLQTNLNLTAFLTGCVLLGFSVPYAVASYAIGRLRQWKKPLLPLLVSLAATAAGLLGLTFAHFPTLYTGALIACGAGIGATASLVTILTQQHTPPEEAGVVTSGTLAVKYLAAAVATTVSANALEAVHGSVGGAAADDKGVALVFRTAASLVIAGSLLVLPAIISDRRAHFADKGC